jgi:threonine dehydrogenase-like Zn-dependent dehydrogenase
MVMFKYMNMHGSMGYFPHETEEALALIVEDRVNRDLLISHKLPLSQVAEGFALQANPAESMKVIITMDE